MSVQPDGRILFADGITEEARAGAIRKLLSSGYSAHEIAKGCVYEDELGWPRLPDRVSSIVDITTDCNPDRENDLPGRGPRGKPGAAN